MKKLILASAIAMIATGASAATVYQDEGSSLDIRGRIEGRAQYDNEKTADISRVRFGIAGQSAITEETDAVAYYEAEMNKDGYKETRKAYVGMETVLFSQDFGAYYGKVDGALGQITDFTDILNTYGAWAGSKVEVSDRTENNLLFVVKGDNFTSKLNYADETATRGAGESFSGVGHISGFSYGLGYSNQDELDGTTSGNKMVAAGLNLGDFYAGGLYSFGQEKDVDYTGYEFAAKYTFTDFTVAATYTTKDVDGQDADTHIDGDIGYVFNSNLNAYVGVSVETTGKEDKIGMVGAKYVF